MKGDGAGVLRVAAYCRVSTDSGDQQNSLLNQKQYFERYISQHPAWHLVNVYADEGITGTSTRRRKQFNAMLAAAERGEIDLILTKEVSRFARNTMDALAHTRRLRELGVGVLFISDNIDTRENDGEFRLTIMASVAQEESRKTSERVKWGQKRSMERGVVFGNDSLYGYQTRGGVLTVRGSEAEVVRLIFRKCTAENKGTHVIARELQEAGIATPRAGARWSPATVRRILMNEKYCGDLLQKKYITPDFLSHKKIPNRGLEAPVYLRNHHEAIISREDYARAQAALARRKPQNGARPSARYWCSGKIRCGVCGSPFLPRRTVRTDGSDYLLWCCRARRQGGGCPMSAVNHKVLADCARYALMNLDWGQESALSALAAILAEPQNASDIAPASQTAAQLRRKRERALDAFLSGEMTAEELAHMRESYDVALAALENRIAQETSARSTVQNAGDWQKALAHALASSEEVLAETVEGVIAHDNLLDFVFWGIPLRFRVQYRVSGKGKNYAAEILGCTAEALRTDQETH
ncbi:MAG: recombinase family protein [Intestinibacillus sp.]